MFWSLTFSLLVRSFYAPCRQGLFFSRCHTKVDEDDRQSEALVRITSNTRSWRERKIFRNPYWIPRPFGNSDLPLQREKNMSSDGNGSETTMKCERMEILSLFHHFYALKVPKSNIFYVFLQLFLLCMIPFHKNFVILQECFAWRVDILSMMLWIHKTYLLKFSHRISTSKENQRAKTM